MVAGRVSKEDNIRIQEFSSEFNSNVCAYVARKVRQLMTSLQWRHFLISEVPRSI